MTIDLEKLKYPIGKFKKPEQITGEDILPFIEVIESFPQRLKALLDKADPEQIDTPYRPGGWTVRQVVHHCADSHMNAYIRFKLALTEDIPAIKPYLEARWAELHDSLSMPVDVSVSLLEALHSRWTVLLHSMGKEDLKRSFFHPEKQSTMSLDETMALYAWHCNHHLGHVRSVIEN